MKEPPGATRQDYERHITALTERHGHDWVVQKRRQIDALWDSYPHAALVPGAAAGLRAHDTR